MAVTRCRRRGDPDSVGRWRDAARIAQVAVAAGLLLGGCAATPDADALRAEPVPINTRDGSPPLRDGRADFRNVFCAILHANGPAPDDDAGCERWLWRLPDEPGHTEAYGARSAAPANLAIFVVTGAFSECVGENSRPFGAAAARWRTGGATVETIVVGGRSGTAGNARQIAAAIEQASPGEERTVIVIGYSKGTLDTLRFLVDFPLLAARVDALVSIAGPVFGTPLADTAEPTYAALLAKLPYDKCPPGDGEVINSLRPAVAIEWITANPPPAGVRYYSLAAFTTREHVARVLVPAWRMLNRHDARNDGQVLAADAVVPGSTLLGYANADHWGVAQQIEVAHPFLAGRRDPMLFPLDPLFDAIVQFVSADLRDGSRSLLPLAAPATAAEGRGSGPPTPRPDSLHAD